MDPNDYYRQQCLNPWHYDRMVKHIAPIHKQLQKKIEHE